jgi:hypothetical protein
MRDLRPFAAFALLAALSIGASGCASSKKPQAADAGFRTLDATVVGRDYEPPGSGGASYAGSGNYYLVFEAREGEANATYRFPVTRVQYQRYLEGSHVRIVLAGHDLRDIRPLQ